MLIAVDCDEVLCDLNEAFLVHHNKMYGTTLTRDDITAHFFHDVVGVELAELFRRFDLYYGTEEFKLVQPIIGAVDAIRLLRERGHELVVITARPSHIEELTLAWLQLHFPSTFREVHFTHFEKNKTKADICVGLGVDVFIEDSPAYALSAAQKGIKVLLMHAPWNKHVQHENIACVYSWDEIVEKLSR